MVRTQFEEIVWKVRSDNGKEFTNGLLRTYFRKNGILHETSCVDTPQQNGRVEQKNRHVLNVARALRFQGSLPLKFWGECMPATTYVINRTPKTPYEVLHGVKPSYNHIKVFGCLCYAHNHELDRDKFDV